MITGDDLLDALLVVLVLVAALPLLHRLGWLPYSDDDQPPGGQAV